MKKTDPAQLARRNYGFIKGRLAEGIVERLFFSLDIDVYPVGLEVKNPHIARLRSKGKIKTKPIEKFEHGPDFLLCQHNKKEDSYNLFEIEVKFRKSSYIDTSELKKYKDPSIIFVFLNKKNFYCIKNSEFQKILKTNKQLKILNFKDFSLLKNHSVFKFSRTQKNIIHAFSFLIEASLNKLENDKNLAKIIKKKCQNLCYIDLKNTFNILGNSHEK